MGVASRHPEAAPVLSGRRVPHEFAANQRIDIALLKSGRELVPQHLDAGETCEADATAASNELVPHSFRPNGAGGPPNAFVNGQPVIGALPYDAFKTIIDQELK